MIRYGNISRKYARYQPWHQNVFKWRSHGSGGVGHSTHKRLYHNWLFYGGKYQNVIVWQNAGSSVAPPVTVSSANHYQPIQTLGRMFNR